jgi:hypothetical protein
MSESNKPKTNGWDFAIKVLETGQILPANARLATGVSRAEYGRGCTANGNDLSPGRATFFHSQASTLFLV